MEDEKWNRAKMKTTAHQKTANQTLYCDRAINTALTF